ncbi:hypothetical protein [Sphingomonas lacunae]|uniref:hypothetical protein n=1 Tax=Sphingomonas lacunae TaxID=2698828 RepID=UPI001FEC7923|nr:hypothetical protein [Sphingomonas lacunae]
MALSACSTEPDNQKLAEVEAQHVRDAADAGRIFCALNGEQHFQLNCTLDRIASADGQLLMLGRADAGYRRFRITSDGRGVVTADGADEARVSLMDNGLIEVAVAQDRYRLPATVRR